MNNPIGYGETYAVCSVCKKILTKALARFDGEPTYVGYNRCEKHPRADAEYRSIKELDVSLTESQDLSQVSK